ncbi:MAG: DUF1365 domain-containing protein [Solirubrobacterales bacterium]|nr:DUF1365 domain-containing protein [Solirubrobacterales bacterium]
MGFSRRWGQQRIARGSGVRGQALNTASCLYEGSILHLRREPRRRFRHPLALAYLDLAELPSLLGGRLIRPSPGLVRFRRRDYLGDPSTELDHAVRELVERQIGDRPRGPVRVLAQLRSFGHCFNPVSFYYCLDETGGQIQALVAEVTNTPWGERHAYVIPEGAGRFEKALHVSPFLAMDHTYVCRSTLTGSDLSVHIENTRQGERVFDAVLTLRRRELSPASMRRTTARYPFATLRVLGLIYMHAIGLRLAGAATFPHPARAQPAALPHGHRSG